MTAKTTASRKAKGRKFQQYVAEKIRTTFGLNELDVRSTSMGASGVDIQLSSEAALKFPYAVECKSVERLNIWDAWQQANQHARELELQPHPIVVFKKSRTNPLVVLDFDRFMELIEENQRLVEKFNEIT